MSPTEIANVAYQAGFRGTALVYAVAVALAESAGNVLAHNTKGEDSRGLWQINVAQGAHPSLASLDLFDPLTNAKQAYAISSGGADWSAWSTWPGAAMANIVQATNAVANAGIAVVPGGPQPITSATPAEVSGLGKQVSDALASPGSTLADLAKAIGAIPITLGNGLDELKNLGAFFEQPNLWLRVLMVVGGGLVTIVGLVLVAASFLPKGGIRAMAG